MQPFTGIVIRSGRTANERRPFCLPSRMTLFEAILGRIMTALVLGLFGVDDWFVRMCRSWCPRIRNPRDYYFALVVILYMLCGTVASGPGGAAVPAGAGNPVRARTTEHIRRGHECMTHFFTVY